MRFDIVLIRAAPFGPAGTPKIRAGFELLRPGGWYFEAGWGREPYDTPPTEWASQHGYTCAEQHDWQYIRHISTEEYQALRIETRHFEKGARRLAEIQPLPDGRGYRQITREHLLIAQKPGPTRV